ncbi:MAG TPA: nicotinate-nucleotide adenylyltransferase [candidate division Zixibacteria bacterium]|nr:nicotinate-nucleotide adenylyltransferase [candidate division Zixibacteria bacterium]
MARRGIFGGSFDPPHMGHLIIAQAMVNSLELDILTWVPAKTPPHKDSANLTSAEHRYRMTELAISGNPTFAISDVEMDSNQPPWTKYLLRRFKQDFPDDELFLIIGGDSLAEFHTWRDYRELWQLAKIAVARRQGEDLSGVDREILDNVKIVDTPLIEISATGIRRMIAEGKSIRYLVPETVRIYIEQHELYIDANSVK